MGETPLPTGAELGILRVLWDRGPSTVREIHEALARTQTTGYTTTLKLLQIMLDKRLVRRDASARSHIYEASVPRATTQRRLVHDLVERAFEGSAARLVLRALADERASAADLQEIRRLLDELGTGAA